MHWLLAFVLLFLLAAGLYVFVIDPGLVALDDTGMFHWFGRTACIIEVWGCWTRP